MCDEYITECFNLLSHEDGLCIMAKGLGIRKLLGEFLRFHIIQHFSLSSKTKGEKGPGVVFCINHMEGSGHNQSDYNCSSENLHSYLLTQGILPHQLPIVINSEILSKERQEQYYNKGGVFLITSRILIVDMLDGIIDPVNILGFLIPNAHRINDNSVEAFILRLYRENNIQQGFVKAFTEDAEALIGENKLESCLKLLFIKKLYLYPRFHQSITSTFSKFPLPEVVEVHVPLSKTMSVIQSAILACIKACIGEIKRGLPKYDQVEDLLAFDNGLLFSKSLDYLLRKALEPDWHKLSFRVKRLLNDLRDLRDLLDHLLKYDTFNFHFYLKKLKQIALHENKMTYDPSLWLTTPAADELFAKAHERIYKIFPISQYTKLKNQISMMTDEPESIVIMKKHMLSIDSFYHDIIKEVTLPPDVVLLPVLECPPKWISFKEVINDILNNHKSNTSCCKILVLVRDDLLLGQLQEYLVYGWEYLSERRYRWYISQSAGEIRSLQLFGTSTKLNQKNKHSSTVNPAIALKKVKHYRDKELTRSSVTIHEEIVTKEKSVTLNEDMEDIDDNKTNLDDKVLRFGLSIEAFNSLSAEDKLILIEEARLLDFQHSNQNSLNEVDVDVVEEEANPVEQSLEDIQVIDIEKDEELKPSSTLKTKVSKSSDQDSINMKSSRAIDILDENADVFGTMMQEPGISIDSNSNMTINLVFMTHNEALGSHFDVMSEVNPTDIVMYDFDISLIRQVEVYQSNRCRLLEDTKTTADDESFVNAKVHFLMYDGSAEKHRYVDTLTREKKAFESLMSSRATLLISLPDSKEVLQKAQLEDLSLIGDSREVARELNISMGDIRSTTVVSSISSTISGTSRRKIAMREMESLIHIPQVIVDVREFRSPLPSILHKHGFKIIPRTITVGDYILGVELCVERKGISDLYQSFASGRLYNQAEAMCKYYKYPCLLIEFTADKAFSLQSASDIPDHVSSSGINTRLAVLAIQFPTLRILWSKSPTETTKIFRTLMKNMEPIDELKAMTAGITSFEDIATQLQSSQTITSYMSQSKTSQNNDNIALTMKTMQREMALLELRQSVRDILLKFPGINMNNFRLVMNEVKNLKQLGELDKSDLIQLLGNIFGKQLYKFLHHKT